VPLARARGGASQEGLVSLLRGERMRSHFVVAATAIVAAIGNGVAFHKGRDFAAWLGILPRQYSTGGKAKLLGISKRGNVYLRKILIHGARAAVLRIKRDRAPIGPGSMHSMPELPKMLLWLRWQTSSRGSHRLCCRAEETTGQWGILLPHEIVRKRRLRLGSADALPLSRTTTTD
jgi:hypothetical protein